MDCTIDRQDGVVIVAPRGDLDHRTAPVFQAQIDDLLGAGEQFFVLDLDTVPLVDSAGLASLIRLYRQVRIGEGDVRLARPTPAVRAVLELTRLDRVFDIFPTVAEAAGTIRQAD
jgi:anti-sigma B factor antagonist